MKTKAGMAALSFRAISPVFSVNISHLQGLGMPVRDCICKWQQCSNVVDLRRKVLNCEDLERVPERSQTLESQVL